MVKSYHPVWTITYTPGSCSVNVAGMRKGEPCECRRHLAQRRALTNIMALGNKAFKENPEKELIFCFTANEAQLLLDALVELPSSARRPIFKIQKCR